MTEPTFIVPTPPDDHGLDYVWLRDRGLEIIRQLAGGIWTDYNEHDPGVTTLELLCYALTELSYRARLPIEDLLARSDTHRIDPNRQGLSAPQTILSGNPTTERDYRKLIVDRVPEVANAWLTSHQSSRPDAVNGLYEVELYIPVPLSGSNGPIPRRDSVLRRVQRVYTRHRSLCEDVRGIHILKQVRTTLTARVAIDASAAPEAVLARLFYNAGNLLAPEPKRRPLDQLIADSQTPARIFSGPLLRNGFISDDQLEPRPDSFTAGRVWRTLLDTEGVTGVRDVSLAIDGASMTADGPHSTLQVPPGRILRLDTRPAGGSFSLRLFRNDVECRPVPHTVQRELDRLWANHRRRYRLRAQCERLLPFPVGTPVDVGEYSFIQHQFPDVYGINARGLPADATDERKAQARQFKAYLLLFEQLTADAFARLAAVKDLCDVRGGRPAPAFQFLDTCVPDVSSEPGPPKHEAPERGIERGAHLLKASYRTELPRIIERGDRALERRNRFLDLMLATYGETGDPVAHVPGGDASEQDAAQARGKRDLLRHVPRIGRRRGAGMDYLAPASSGTGTGPVIKSRLQLGMAAATPRLVVDLLNSLGVEIIGTAPLEDRALMLRCAEHIEKHFVPVDRMIDGVDRPDAARLTLGEDLLAAAADVDHYRIGTLPGEAGVMAVCRAPRQPSWQLVGEYADRHEALAGVSALLGIARAINRHARQLYIVEHTLLRFGRTHAPPAEADADFEPSFTATAVVCLTGREADDPGHRTHACTIIRDNTPAHIAIDTRFIRLSHLGRFESLYWNWRTALRRRKGRQLIEACRQLRDFLRPDPP